MHKHYDQLVVFYYFAHSIFVVYIWNTNKIPIDKPNKYQRDLPNGRFRQANL